MGRHMATQLPKGIVVCQLNQKVGDIEGNCHAILSAITQARKMGGKLLIFPELALMGYPPYDLLFERDIMPRIERALATIASSSSGIDLIVGAPLGPLDSIGRPFNSAIHIRNENIVGRYDKRCLPCYDVFNDPRYFQEGSSVYTFDFQSNKIAVLICEDMWSLSSPWEELYAAHPIVVDPKIDLLVVISASPWHQGKERMREEVGVKAAAFFQAPIISVNRVGGQDDLLFDGESFACLPSGKLFWRASAWQEGMFQIEEGSIASEGELVEGLLMGIRDYVRKAGANRVVVGLSGGIDSAVVAALACLSLGKEQVELLFLPSRFTSEESREDAYACAKALDCSLTEISIEPLFKEALHALQLSCDGSKGNLIVENLQARLRMVLLMSFANRPSHLLLSTSNKSELGVGYSTLYGDIAGAVAPLGDLLKSEVYELGRKISKSGFMLPERLFQKHPSPELFQGQLDEEELPLPYRELDPLLHKIIVDKEVVPIREQVFSQEFKRRQAPIVLKVSQKAFGSGRLFPVT